ncbi:hypothetical protein H6764_03395, partial [Candidatus Nomurabacteria bacterium]|nr:hypothetical protein [Candidatus Nomurabacteria bacterium]
PDPTPEPQVVPGDINQDGEVSLADYAVFVGDYLDCRNTNECNSRSDIDSDGKVSIKDYSKFLDIYLRAR